MITERKPVAELTKLQAATRLSTSVRTVERYIRAGHLTAVKRKNGRVYVDSTSVERFLEGEPALAEADR